MKQCDRCYFFTSDGDLKIKNSRTAAQFWPQRDLSVVGSRVDASGQRSIERYRKIPKTSPGAYIFQRGNFLEGLMFGGACLRREICVSKSIGLALSWKEIYRFGFVLLCIGGQFSKYKPPGGLYLEGRFR